MMLAAGVRRPRPLSPTRGLSASSDALLGRGGEGLSMISPSITSFRLTLDLAGDIGQNYHEGYFCVAKTAIGTRGNGGRGQSSEVRREQLG